MLIAQNLAKDVSLAEIAAACRLGVFDALGDA